MEKIMSTEINGKQLKSSFWLDFSIAECFGSKAILDYYYKTMQKWGTDVSYAKELVLVLNHKIAQYYETMPLFAALYYDLWKKADEQCREYFSEPGREASLEEYFRFLD